MMMTAIVLPMEPPEEEYDDDAPCAEYASPGEDCVVHEGGLVCSECQYCTYGKLRTMHYPERKEIVTAYVCRHCWDDRDVEQCGECRQWWHVDLDMVHGGVCLACDDNRSEFVTDAIAEVSHE